MILYPDKGNGMIERVIPAAIIALGLVAASLLYGGRYTIVKRSDDTALRLDRYTGKMWLCGALMADPKARGYGTGIACVRIEEDGPPLPLNSN